MELKNRIKQSAEINASGEIVFGAAISGFLAIDPIAEFAFSTPYLLTDFSGVFEYGLYAVEDTEGLVVHPRQVWETSHPLGAFPAGTVGLILSIPAMAQSSVAATGSYGTPPEAAGLYNTAVGHSTLASGSNSTAVGYSATAEITRGATAIGSYSGDSLDFSTAVGYKATAQEWGQSLGAYSRTEFGGETQFGHFKKPHKAHIPIAGNYPTPPGAIDTFWLVGGTQLWVTATANGGNGSGAFRIKGEIMIADTAYETPNSIRLYSVNLLAHIDDTLGVMTVLGVPEVVETYVGSAPCAASVAWDVPSSSFVVNNSANLTAVDMRGVVEITRFVNVGFLTYTAPTYRAVP